VLLAEEFARLFLPPPPRVLGEHATLTGRQNNQALHGLNRADPKIGWVLTAGPVQFRHRLVDEAGAVQYDVVYSIFGGHRRTSGHTERGPQIIVTGCSFTFGHGLRDEDTWPWMLQTQLPRYEVVNAAAMGYGTDQALLAAERAVNPAPNRIAAVVLGLGDFQIERNRSSQGWLVHLYPFAKPLFSIDGSTVRYQGQVRSWSQGMLAERSNLFAFGITALANRIYRIPTHDQARELTVALISAFARKFQDLGVRFAAVMLPYAGDESPQSQADTGFLVRRLRRAGIPVLTLEFPRLADGRFDVKKFMVTPLDKHPNRLYNENLTSQLARFLHANGIVSEPLATN
jgi:hypothetical protein